VAELVQTVVDALSAGALYALVALGIALIFGVLGLINFAHAELITLGAYSALLTQSAPWPILVLAALLTCVLMALLMERIAFRPVRGADGPTLLVTSFAVSFLIQSLLDAALSSTARSVKLPAFVSDNVTVGAVRIDNLDMITIGAAAFLLIGGTAFLRKSRVGVEMRAAAEDFEMARLLGVNANRVIAAAFAVSGLLAGGAALIFLGQTASVTPTLGVSIALVGFVATVLGGLNSLPAAALGGLLLGIVATLLQELLPLGLRPYRDVFLFAAVILTLLFRPDGLLTREQRYV
jgi:branched-chain amino acid transport system permease protein